MTSCVSGADRRSPGASSAASALTSCSPLPKGLPAAEVQKLRDAVAAALAAPEVKEVMDRQGNVINVLSVDAAQKFFRDETVKYAALSKKIGLEAQ